MTKTLQRAWEKAVKIGYESESKYAKDLGSNIAHIPDSRQIKLRRIQLRAW